MITPFPSPACGGGCRAKRGGWGLPPQIPSRREPPPRPSPASAGLSHMAERCHEEGIVPASTFDFAPYGCAIGVGSQDVEGKPAKNGEVLGSIVLSRAIAILGEMDVEHPMELVLDCPVTAGDV